MALFEWDLGINCKAAAFRQTKLTAEHVHLTSRSKMNVALAVQVFFVSLALIVSCFNDIFAKMILFEKILYIVKNFFKVRTFKNLY